VPLLGRQPKPSDGFRIVLGHAPDRPHA
jgi:hypothetical protein